MNIIGPDCEKIVLDYKKSFDFILEQNKNLITLFDSKCTCKMIRIKNLNILYEDFKELYLGHNYNNKTIKFTTNSYGSGHYMCKKVFDLDLHIDCDEILYGHRVIRIHKIKDTIIIDLYNNKYDYDFLDKNVQVKKSDETLTYDSDSDLDDLI